MDFTLHINMIKYVNNSQKIAFIVKVTIFTHTTDIYLKHLQIPIYLFYCLSYLSMLFIIICAEYFHVNENSFDLYQILLIILKTFYSY